MDGIKAIYEHERVYSDTFLAVPLLLVMAAMLACFLPAQRAARVDPVIALRSE